MSPVTTDNGRRTHAGYTVISTGKLHHDHGRYRGDDAGGMLRPLGWVLPERRIHRL